MTQDFFQATRYMIKSNVTFSLKSVSGWFFLKCWCHVFDWNNLRASKAYYFRSNSCKTKQFLALTNGFGNRYVNKPVWFSQKQATFVLPALLLPQHALKFITQVTTSMGQPKIVLSGSLLPNLRNRASTFSDLWATHWISTHLTATETHLVPPQTRCCEGTSSGSQQELMADPTCPLWYWETGTGCILQAPLGMTFTPVSSFGVWKDPASSQSNQF